MAIGDAAVSIEGVYVRNVGEAIEMTNAQNRKILALWIDEGFASTEHSEIFSDSPLSQDMRKGQDLLRTQPVGVVGSCFTLFASGSKFERMRTSK